jgi:hypothetical protein
MNPMATGGTPSPRDPDRPPAPAVSDLDADAGGFGAPVGQQRVRAVRLSLDRLFDRPDWMLQGFDLPRRLALFVRMTRRGYEESAFLDDRASRAGDGVLSLSLDELFDAAAERPDPHPHPHYLFHTGFCGSTLFARGLDHRGVAFGIREPLPLHLLARMRLDPPGPGPEWGRLFRLSLRLLNRSYDDGSVVLIKLDVNSLYGDLLLQHEASRALFLHGAPEDFLAAGLKEVVRRRFYREQFQRHRGLIASQPGSGPLFDRLSRGPGEPSDGEIIAAYWLYQMRQIESMYRRDQGGRIRSLSIDSFFADPVGTLTAAASWFGLRLRPERLRRKLASGLLQRHAKDPGRPFDRAARAAELDETKLRHVDEIVRGLRLLEGLGHPFPPPLELRT